MNEKMIVIVLMTVIVIIQAGLAQQFESPIVAAGDIQNAGPLNIDLSNPSSLSSQVDAAIEEHNLGGYRPLYPPYFVRDPPTQAPSIPYRDKEYYTRVDQQQPQPQPQLQQFNRYEFARELVPITFPAPSPSPPPPTVLVQSQPVQFFHHHHQTESASKSVSVHSFAFASAGTARRFRFPVT